MIKHLDLPRPHIVHVVGYSEANHAASADEVIENAVMVQEVVEAALHGNPDMTADPAVQRRKQFLIADPMRLIDAIRAFRPDRPDSLSNPAVLAQAVALGLLDAPQLVNNPYAPARVRTRSIEGAIWAVNDRNQPLDETSRLAGMLAGRI